MLRTAVSSSSSLPTPDTGTAYKVVSDITWSAGADDARNAFTEPSAYRYLGQDLGITETAPYSDFTEEDLLAGGVAQIIPPSEVTVEYLSGAKPSVMVAAFSTDAGTEQERVFVDLRDAQGELFLSPLGYLPEPPAGWWQLAYNGTIVADFEFTLTRPLGPDGTHPLVLVPSVRVILDNNGAVQRYDFRCYEYDFAAGAYAEVTDFTGYDRITDTVAFYHGGTKADGQTTTDYFEEAPGFTYETESFVPETKVAYVNSSAEARVTRLCLYYRIHGVEFNLVITEDSVGNVS